MFNTESTKQLSKLYLKLHSINDKLRTLDIEQETHKVKDQGFDDSYGEYLTTRNELELEMLDVIKQIGVVSNSL